MNNLAITSTGAFWAGDEFDHWRREYEKRRGSFQQCCTRWAHENIQSVGRKEESRFKLTLHRISNELVAETRENGCSVIAFEDLTDIRERTGTSWRHKWAFNRLCEYVEYKAEGHGIEIKQVDHENTLRRCSHCGFTHPDNRDNEDFKCGYENHTGYNAAKNIGLWYLHRHQNSKGSDWLENRIAIFERNQTRGDTGAPLGVRLNSGTLNVNGGYSPGSPEARTGVYTESHDSSRG
ncbi:IS1341-type transposase [Natronorubrum tibetense GA33]|uniref:IS1341-type transposase n=1 Tax=Natronorubrum tibetense GA33 TaxID=1114856 RepID=L9VKX6_9EURY|nr:IS1341-type transposase [Natronorubrum tibetense GA33]